VQMSVHRRPWNASAWLLCNLQALMHNLTVGAEDSIDVRL